MGPGMFDGMINSIIVLGILTCLFVGGIVYAITKLSEPKELVVKKRLVPELRLTTDGKKVDTVFVYKIK